MKFNYAFCPKCHRFRRVDEVADPETGQLMRILRPHRRTLLPCPGSGLIVDQRR